MVDFPNAKINIGLQILRRRPDSYHDIETVFYPVPLYDVLEIIEAPETNIFLSGIPIPGDGNNLCQQVYDLMRNDFDIPSYHIYLQKNIPIGAGLGGGSSDAAFLIKLINQHAELGLDEETMEAYATKIGADCAFFIKNKPVFATGIGNRFTSVEVDLSEFRLVLVKPPLHISTFEAFRDVAFMEKGRNLNEAILQPVGSWRGLIYNDFEDMVFRRYPEVKEIKDELYAQGAVYASMSGTGSCVFGLFTKDAEVAKIGAENWETNLLF